MEYSKSGLALTERFEGCRLTAYQDVGGIWTVGFGHTGPEVVEGLSITQEQAEKYLEEDIANSVDAVNGLVTVTLAQNEFDSLVDFVYNVGRKNFANSTLLAKLNEGDYPGAADEFDRWSHVGGQVVAGLLRRRQAEAGQFSEGFEDA